MGLATKIQIVFSFPRLPLDRVLGPTLSCPEWSQLLHQQDVPFAAGSDEVSLALPVASFPFYAYASP
jgi:hypothetical protein